MMKQNITKLFLAVLFINALTACGPKADYVSVYDRQVPVDTNTSTGLPNTEGVDSDNDSSVELPADPVAPPASYVTVGLRQKVLASSNIPVKALDNAFAYFDEHHEKIKNQKYLTIFDIGQHSGKKRFYLINMVTGEVKTMHVAHGAGSDADGDGYATQFSNIEGSKQSSLGFMITAERYFGSNGLSLRLDGQESRNDNVRMRAVVVHGADYVSPDMSTMGRSWGCPAVSHDNVKWLIPLIEKGSLFYIFNSKYD